MQRAWDPVNIIKLEQRRKYVVMSDFVHIERRVIIKHVFATKIVRDIRNFTCAKVSARATG